MTPGGTGTARAARPDHTPQSREPSLPGGPARPPSRKPRPPGARTSDYYINIGAPPQRPPLPRPPPRFAHEKARKRGPRSRSPTAP
jgi:hypothetical protein